jgi:oligoendopeptidase F
VKPKLFAAAVILMYSLAAQAEALTDRWNLADLYPLTSAWVADAELLQRQMGDFAACKGHLGDSAANFRRCLDLRSAMEQRLARLEVFAGEQYAADTGDPGGLELRQRAELTDNRLSEATAFVDPEILAIGADRIAGFVAAEPALKVHAYPLAKTLRLAAHTLDGAGEQLLADTEMALGSAAATYSILTNADMPWPTVKLSTGQEVRLDAAAYTKYRESPDRGDRKKVMDAFFGTFKAFERSLGVTLYSQLKETTALSKVRHYPDSLSRSLDRNHVPAAVIDTLIAETNVGLPTLHRYFRLRAKILGVTDLQYHDIYPPLVHGGRRIPLDEAKATVLAAVKPLGADYVKALKAGFDGRWMDAYPRPNKQSGAHMAGHAYDVHPYVLMNYNDDYESMTTLAHEWGHALHSVLANKTQPFVTANYAIFVAEIASTFNEELLLREVLAKATSDDDRLLFLGSALEGLRATFFRQAMFAEFERRIHSEVDRGESLGGATFSKIYCEILDRHHGVAQGVMAISRTYCAEWAYIPHFYNAFYVYQYATSIAASSLFSDRVRAGEAGALERYLDLLKAGGSDDPHELVKRAGVDLASPAPYRSLVARMNLIMDQIEAILTRRG